MDVLSRSSLQKSFLKKRISRCCCTQKKPFRITGWLPKIFGSKNHLIFNTYFYIIFWKKFENFANFAKCSKNNRKFRKCEKILPNVQNKFEKFCEFFKIFCENFAHVCNLFSILWAKLQAKKNKKALFSLLLFSLKKKKWF